VQWLGAALFKFSLQANQTYFYIPYV